MATKLTLSIDPKVIERAKKYSEQKGVSLSKLIEEYLQKITGSAKRKSKRSILELRGIGGPLPADFDHKKAVRDYVYEKHFK